MICSDPRRRASFSLETNQGFQLYVRHNTFQERKYPSYCCWATRNSIQPYGEIKEDCLYEIDLVAHVCNDTISTSREGSTVHCSGNRHEVVYAYEGAAMPAVQVSWTPVAFS
mmetsp:Transcript_8094/g.10242  ORF Transcript_8094/g.10242 Transcript_8094/m.10242 type:complete len:112 (+) Transcript_8094:320-655(+)